MESEYKGLGKPHSVMLFNSNMKLHDVAKQISRATHCCTAEALYIAIQAETEPTEVIVANLERCEHVASVLEEINLKPEIKESML